MPKEPTPDFSYTFNGLIWKTVPDIERNLLALEVRNNENHKTGFYVINLNSNEFLLKDWVFSETWWVSLLALSDTRIYMRLFPDEQDPSNGEIQAFDIINKTILWTIDGLVPVEFGHHEILAFIGEGENRRFCAVNPLTGQVTYPEQAEARENSASRKTNDNRDLYYPVHYAEDDDNFRMIGKFLEKLGIKPSLAVDYLEFREYIIISYCQRENNDMESFLLLLDREGSVIFNKNTGSGLPGAGKDTFFVMNNGLIFASNKNNLIRIGLT